MNHNYPSLITDKMNLTFNSCLKIKKSEKSLITKWLNLFIVHIN